MLAAAGCWSQLIGGFFTFYGIQRGVGSISAWGDNTTAVLPANLTGVLTAALNEKLSCVVLSAGGTVQCYGTNAWGGLDVPLGLAGVTDIDMAFTFGVVCVVAARGKVVCWGRGPMWTQVAPPADLPPAKAVVAGDEYACALLVAGTVRCWGQAFNPASIPPPGLSSVTAITGGSLFTCALKADTTVVCWGQNQQIEGITPPANLTGVVSIVSGIDHICALTASGSVVCWGGPPEAAVVPPGFIPAGQQAIQMAAAAADTCVTLSDSTIKCFGVNFQNPKTDKVPPACPRAL